MQYTTGSLFRATLRVLPVRIHLLVIVTFLALALLGHPLEVSAGWLVWPPVVYLAPSPSRSRRRREHHCRVAVASVWSYARKTWAVPLLRSCALAVLWLGAGPMGSPWVIVLPWTAWVGLLATLLWPSLARQPEWWLLQRAVRLGERIVLWVYVALALVHGLRHFGPGPVGKVLGQGVCLGVAPSVTVTHDEAHNCYSAELQGRFTLAVADDDPFRLRLLVLFLRLLEVPDEHRGSRRTRDGRTPFVRQQYLAQALGIPQPDLSRWEGYWHDGDWRRLLSQMAKEVLTLELQQRIIETWAHWPGWGVEQVHRFLVARGVAVTESQVRQAAHESGWQIVRQVLARLCAQGAEELRLRDDWLVGDILALMQRLLGRLEEGQERTPEEQLDLEAWQAALAETGLQARPPGQAQPWLERLEQVLFRPWQEVTTEQVRCPHCGSDRVGRKGLKPRVRKYVDQQGQVRSVEVYRYRCHNPACPYGSFTVLPPGLLPYSRRSLEVHVLALQMYAWGYSTYRRTGQALGVASITAYRWVSAFGYQLLPVAALFGVVKSSGVVGVDEKWVQVTKNNKPAGQHRKWMYVYVAADAYTYDLLHIAIYPRNTAESAQAFLLALRSKGYHPRVVITDLRQDYGRVIARVFPQAQHHECLFHASQALHRQLAEIYGWDALRTDERVLTLREALDGPLQARTKRTAQQRYDRLMAERDRWVGEKPELAAVFRFLEGHWPKLANGIESDLIPRTNNTAELVIRRFDQHYQSFCGFDSLETAERYLAVFEKVYRFTPFSADAQPGIRGKSPLQLAGYDVTNLPIAAACSGWAITLPTHTSQGGVPNV
ncbi:MAG: transposase [Anaerolineae bacterium]|nr:transposase [Anaerolineae bacterium]